MYLLKRECQRGEDSRDDREGFDLAHIHKQEGFQDL